MDLKADRYLNQMVIRIINKYIYIYMNTFLTSNWIVKKVKYVSFLDQPHVDLSDLANICI